MRSKILVVSAVVATTFTFPAAAWAAVTFAPATAYSVGDGPTSVAAGDLNGDGKPDLVTADAFADAVSVLLGNGDGTFAAATQYAVGDSPVEVAIADVNGDNKPDLVVADGVAGTVSVLLGNGDGTFAAATQYPVGDFPRSVTVADLNGDNKLDIVTSNVTTDNVGVLLGNGDGTFAAATTYAVGDSPDSVAIADLNGDNKPDLVAADSFADTVSVLLGNGDGTFAAATPYAVGDFPLTVTIADLNGDGRPDLATANLIANNVSVLLGNGDGTFAALTAYPVGGSPRYVVAFDLDDDGKLDLVSADSTSDAISVLLGNGDGTFAAATAYGAGDFPESLAIADLNGDTKPDVATSNFPADAVGVLLNTTLDVFTTGPTASISGTVRQGQTLTADEGSPDPTPDSFSYKWFADGAEIIGETAKTLLLTSTHVGKKISVEVTAIKGGFTDASDTSPETVPVVGIFTPGPTASIGGYRRVGATLTARTGTPVPTPTSFAYRWYANGTLLSTKTKTLKLTTAHYGKRIRVKVFALKSGYQTATSLSPATAAISNLQAKTISMELSDYTVYRGQRIYAEIELLAPGEAWSIVLDGKKLASGKANTKGIAVTGLTIPTTALRGDRILRAYGAFPDRTDPDKITVR